MDLLSILEERVSALPEGEHTPGLAAVATHVRVAIAHMDRGRTAADETAYTDAIYRTNQAFEGSLKEAYRVLAEKDPDRVRPFDIESYFEQEKTLRSRVLTQFTRYRQEWRNPSTHDYRLDFDENEALLAIVSVGAFAAVLVDQIAEKLSFDQAKAAGRPLEPDGQAESLARTVASAITRFSYNSPERASGEPPREAEVLGALAGYISAALPNADVTTEARVKVGGRGRVDILVSLGEERVFVEVKRSSRHFAFFHGAIGQVSAYMADAGVAEAVLYLHGDHEAPLHIQEVASLNHQGKILVVSGPEAVPTAGALRHPS